jgi:hypothetical protein
MRQGLNQQRHPQVAVSGFVSMIDEFGRVSEFITPHPRAFEPLIEASERIGKILNDLWGKDLARQIDSRDFRSPPPT